MDYVRKFLHVDGIIGQGAFGRVLVTSPLQNQIPQQHQPTRLTNRSPNRTSPESHRAISCEEQQAQQQGQQVIPKSVGSKGHLPDGATGGSRFALKCVHPILKPQRLVSELRHLRDLGGTCNVVQMHAAHFFQGSLYIVMELIEHDRFVDVVAQLDYSEIVIYMKNLLIALEHVHKHNIMHRDIKPANFLFNRKDKKFLLVDFGLAQVVRTRSTLFANRTTPATVTTNPISLLSSPTTPTSTGRRTIAPLFPELYENRKDIQSKLNYPQNGNPLKASVPSINLKSSHIIYQSPARHFINLTPTGSPNIPNVSTKRSSEMLNPNDFNSMLKKLRVSNNEETKEPVKLTVGAYESPVTNTDSGQKRHINFHHKFSTPTIPSRRNPGTKCDCRGKPRTCITCLARPDSNAPKSGTPGFKAPEILLRYPNQTTAIDMWSAGVILACLLSGHSPFFRDVDDNVSLAEIITILGSRRVIQAARALGLRLIVEPKRDPIDLRALCKSIRKLNSDKRPLDIPDEAFNLLDRMLDPNPMTRITAKEALQHPWFNPMTEV